MSSADGALVVGLDGSPDSERGVGWAVDEAVGRGLALRPVHALPIRYDELGPTTAAGSTPTRAIDAPRGRRTRA